MIIKPDELAAILEKILLSHGFKKSDAKTCVNIFVENTLVGVSSHGINRFPDFIHTIQSGHIKPAAKPVRINKYNALEQWDGQLGPGPVNASLMTEKTMELAKQYGIGCISLKNTNHWMRPGFYAWEAVKKGYIFICWTNTIPIMPPWGAKTPALGNNPIVFGVPRKEGHIVLDMALSQYSYGKLGTYALDEKDLPYTGGYNREGKLTTNAKEIYKSQRPLPIGLWKGSGLALLLDLIVSVLSGGKSTFDLSKADVDSGVSQMFIAIEPYRFSSREIVAGTVNEILDYYLNAEKDGTNELSYPGERIVKNKMESLKNGIFIHEKIWQKILDLM